jgi:SAM-dependent methyltransferase
MAILEASASTPFDDGELYDILLGDLKYGLDFYLDLAKPAGGPVLDAGCGTGRVMLPCLQAGVDIVGLDLFEPMLARLRESVAKLGLTPRLYRADMSDFRLLDGTRAARRAIHERVTGSRCSVCYWLDLGNSGGQMVLGQPWNWRNRRSAERLRTAAELFPELVDPSLEDDGPSCSALEALDRQEPFVNSTLANLALVLLARLFRYGAIQEHGAFLNVAVQRVQPLNVDSNCWRRLSAPRAVDYYREQA